MVSSSDFIKAVSNAVSISLAANRRDNNDNMFLIVYCLQESKNVFSSLRKLSDDNFQSLMPVQRLGKLIQPGMVGRSSGDVGF